jgi:transposase
LFARYLDPPDRAVVLCVDEKSQIQALDRTQPGLPLKKGRAATMTHDYKRHGTTTLFTALDVKSGIVIGDCMPRHRAREFLTFLRRIDRAVKKPRDIHIVLDNYATHKTSVAAGCRPSPVVQTPEHDLDAVAAFIATLVVFHRLAAGLPTWDARLYPLVFQRISEPISVIAADPLPDTRFACKPCGGQQPFRRWQAARQGSGASVTADPLPDRGLQANRERGACGHEEVDRAALFISDSMQCGVHAALSDRSDDRAPLFYPKA